MPFSYVRALEQVLGREAIVQTLHTAQGVAMETPQVAKILHYVMMCHPDARAVIFNMIELAFGVYRLNLTPSHDQKYESSRKID